YSLIQDDYKEKYPTLDLCLKIYTSREEERYRLRKELLSRDSGFSYLLLTMPEHAALPIQIHPRILRFLERIESEDESLQEVMRLEYPALTDLPQAQKLNQAVFGETGGNVCFLHGPYGVGKKTLAGQAAALAGRPILYFDGIRLYHQRKQLPALVTAMIREMVIRDGVPCLDQFEIFFPEEGDSQEVSQTRKTTGEYLIRQLTKRSPVLFITSLKPWEGEWRNRELSRIDWEIPFPTMTDQIGIWEKILSPEMKETIDPEALCVRFCLTPGQMMGALQEACDQCRVRGREEFKTMLYSACRRQLVMHLGGHVTQIKTQYQWDDLVLPKRQKEALKRACDQVEYSHQVYEVWGFEKKIAYGQGVSLLFYGPPGTGKTMGAQVMANQLHMELYKVDLSSVMSKYIGETEKNLGTIFDEVKKSRSILFFDEADALFGKRTEVKDSHDKYANAETAYLLQKIEEYQGIVVLATNYMQNFDEAFKRRIKFMVEFPFPLPEYRLEMWKKVFPQQLPLEELDYDYLAKQFELSGSSIKNIAVAAAFLAASAKEPVGMQHILPALRDEMVKAGKSMPPESFGEYHSLIRSYG
ncbi:MAG: ATP-binding protein, partial [Lachnospiraceae bacterium]